MQEWMKSGDLCHHGNSSQVTYLLNIFRNYYLDETDRSVHKTEELTLLAFLRKLGDKQDVGNMPHKVNVNGTTPMVHLSLHNNRTVLPMTR